jgi:hypothetical protein
LITIIQITRQILKTNIIKAPEKTAKNINESYRGIRRRYEFGGKLHDKFTTSPSVTAIESDVSGVNRGESIKLECKDFSFLSFEWIMIFPPG